MPFETARTTLREYRPETDVDKLLALWNDPETQRFAFPDYIAPRNKEAVEEFTKGYTKGPAGSSIFVIVEDKESGAFLGQISFAIIFPKTRVADIGISLVRESWGKGYGKELVSWVVQLGFQEWGLHRIQLSASEENERAVALYKHMYANSLSLTAVVSWWWS